MENAVRILNNWAPTVRYILTHVSSLSLPDFLTFYLFHLQDEERFITRCPDRERFTECSEVCLCQREACLNSVISKKISQKLNVDVKETPVYGMDGYTRSQIFKVKNVMIFCSCFQTAVKSRMLLLMILALNKC